MKKFLFLNLLFAIYITVSAQIPTGYYKYADALTGSALKTTLYDVIKGHTQYPYTSSSTDTWDILKQTDKDPANPLNVIMIYSGISIEAAQEWNSGAGWTREHVWSKSHGFPPASGQDPEPGAGTDCHHLRPEKPNVNSAKSDRDFDNCQGLPGAVLANGTTDCWKITDVWDPRDEVKGDVARMMFYMATRYRGENGEPDLALIETIPSSPGYDPFYAKLSTLLLWNEQDPIDAFEINRNEVIYSFQHNRNPYIDHPEWVQRIWGVYPDIYPESGGAFRAVCPTDWS